MQIIWRFLEEVISKIVRKGQGCQNAILTSF